MIPTYNTNPSPQKGSGTYGAVPGIIGLPPNLYSQTAGQFPAVNASGNNAAGFIQAETAGQLNPETVNLLQQKSAAQGVASGMPGSNFSNNNLVESMGLDSQNLAHQGVSDYLSFVTGQGSQMTNPELAYSVAQQNAVDQSAPNPAAAAAGLVGQFQGANMGNRGGVAPFSGSPANISPMDPAALMSPDSNWSNPPVMYGPQGGTSATDMYADASPYAYSGPAASTYDPNDPYSSLGLGLDIGLGSMGGDTTDSSSNYSDTGS